MISKQKYLLSEETSEMIQVVRRGFLLWSWIGLIAAYTSTSAIYANQLYLMMSQGYKSIDFLPFASITMTTLLFPMGVLAVGWFAFYRYSLSILNIVLIPEKAKSEIDELWRVAFLFKSTVLSLILSWISILIAVFIPYLIQIMRYSR